MRTSKSTKSADKAPKITCVGRSRVWGGKSGGFNRTKLRRDIDGMYMSRSLARDIEEGSKHFWSSRRGGVA